MHGSHVIRRLRFTIAVDPGNGEVSARHIPLGPPAPDGLPIALAPLVAASAPAPGDSLSYARLPGDDGAVLCHTPPKGGEADVLFLPNGAAGDLPAMWPIDLWRSPTWRPARLGTAPGRRLGEDTVPRPAMEITDGRLADFARARQARMIAFLSDVRRLFTGSAPGPRIVVAEEDQAAVALWIALACRFLHRFVDESHARSLTFTTRARRPYEAPQQIVGIGPDTDFDRKDLDLLTRYRVHDGLGGDGSRPEPDPWVAKAARVWLRELPGRAGPVPQSPPPSTPERLRLAAERLRGRPHQLHGTGLYRVLAARLPNGGPTDPDTLLLMYELVWGTAGPDLKGALEIARTCPPELVVAARLHLWLTSWLSRPGEITDDRCALAQELLRHEHVYRLDATKRAVAELLVRGQDITAGGEAADEAERLIRARLNRHDTPLTTELLAWARRRLRRYEESARL
ncbi:GTPase-associated protein 1-related protein [Streptomyces sp. NBC_01803]|uniref:GTPase-associated protein 1-related protein n=1 Tax=Streptomyces sp. NBC_01803 TaxID=2975946 RepID=UPI002DD7AB6C|nr:GTPase-associated protein 1-related protein [Streptomyces sp. NBC_01803]WSA46268.1 GTPase-associated protein 1-related protein [Streptomyces sp. NBC_01803]